MRLLASRMIEQYQKYPLCRRSESVGVCSVQTNVPRPGLALVP